MQTSLDCAHAQRKRLQSIASPTYNTTSGPDTQRIRLAAGLRFVPKQSCFTSIFLVLEWLLARPKSLVGDATSCALTKANPLSIDSADACWHMHIYIG